MLSLFSWQNELNKQTGLKGQHNFTLFYFVYMWRTLPPLWLQCSANLILPQEQLVCWKCDIICGSLCYYLINIINITFLSLNFLSAKANEPKCQSTSWQSNTDLHAGTRRLYLQENRHMMRCFAGTQRMESENRQFRSRARLWADDVPTHLEKRVTARNEMSPQCVRPFPRDRTMPTQSTHCHVRPAELSLPLNGFALNNFSRKNVPWRVLPEKTYCIRFESNNNISSGGRAEKR